MRYGWVLFVWLSVSVGCMGVAVITVRAQTSSPAPTPAACDMQVSEQYRQLSTAGLLPQATAPQWGPQLTAMVQQLRIQGTRYDIKKNQAELAEQNVAQLLEQVRVQQEQIIQLKAELEQHKTPAATPPPAAN